MEVQPRNLHQGMCFEPGDPVAEHLALPACQLSHFGGVARGDRVGQQEGLRGDLRAVLLQFLGGGAHKQQPGRRVAVLQA
ncbi:hypothetical protein B591_28814 [Streptomyces sp. GBA 94-10 4N24]|nr:hypothetical protein B591_28814 [Streptomyces sp. GBA 94-10 4N24]UZN62763.1 hypothetical protein B591N_28814 [Streptomyces sp. GBA 94-10 4N24]